MSSKNTKLGSKNGATLQYKVEALVAVEANLKANLEFAVEDLRQGESRVQAALCQIKIGEASRKLVEECVIVAEGTIASVNRDFDAMVQEKDRQLAEVMEELEVAKVKLANIKNLVDEAEAKAVRAYRKSFSTMPEYV
ncbi:hypothetical protein Adt_11424 [Abeliophyllum distichum]|uniref:Uncharacterized protein n=1 Tax=Abeliophyllum distichum TaxID=126358 RepID=A0ABD1UPA1_9LAMI